MANLTKKNSYNPSLPPIIKSFLTPIEEQYIQDNIRLIKLKKNEALYREGDKPQNIYFLQSGKIKVCKMGPSERLQILVLLKQNDFFGYRAWAAHDEYKNSAVAIEQSEVCAIPLTIMAELLQQNNRFALHFLEMLAKYFGHIQSRLVTLTQKNVRGRMAESLLYLVETFGIDANGVIQCALTREDLAALSNMTTANAIRTLLAFAKEGLLNVSGRRITIINLDSITSISLNKYEIQRHK